MADIDVEQVLNKLTVSDKVDLLSGIDNWHTKPLPAHGVPSLRLSDGPNGVRGTRFFNGVKAACFPCGTALGATFNLPLLNEAGRKMGDEAKAKGAHVILGPTINMQRSPLGGRGFESLGEDPVLAGLGAAALVNGIQDTGVQATIKHFVCNDQEHNRNAMQSIVTQRALREIYALPFQIAVRDAAPAAFMTAYNGVNGTYCSENSDLLDKILRKEWGWDGLVMSDWFGTYSTTDATNAGLDLEMPGPPKFRGELLRFNVATDKVPRHVLDDRARNMLNLVKKCAASGVPENAPETTDENTPETAALLRKIGVESLVLLKNKGGILPLRKDKKTVIIGPNAKTATYHGGGSASLAAYYAVTPFDGISAKLTTPPAYTVGSHSHKMLPLLGDQLTTATDDDTDTEIPGMTMRVYNDSPDVMTLAARECIDAIPLTKTELLLIDYNNPKLTSPLWYATLTGTLTAPATGTYQLSLVVCGTARLYVDDELVVDNATVQRQGDAFFGSSTLEEIGSIPVVAGQRYAIRVEFASAVTSKLVGNNVLFGGGTLRVGGVLQIDDPAAEIAHAAALARDADQVVICAGLNADWETEGYDRSGMDLPGHMDALIAAVAEASKGEVVVVMQSGTPVHMPWVDGVAGIVQAWYGGNETGNVIADVLFGDANPSGKLSLSWPRRVEDNPAFLNYRAEAARTLYGEDVYVGYRYYEFCRREVLWPFGHGLSYTTFGLGGLVVKTEGGEGDDDELKKELVVEVTVTNTGDVKGKEVVQVYVSPPKAVGGKVNRPLKELKGFAKTRELAPGESETVSVRVEVKYAGGYWDEVRDEWCVEEGRYGVVVGTSSKEGDGVVRGEFEVKETFWWKGL
ncbi:glycosyl hydrolase family 3 N terminal domain-containing protein [Bombardia bombarda]|uniref:beta-glucosidase n=1 Tax=Bombardia bombarda TaxID=252184 RepID=A0AA40CEV9_9PEZI|nr:glycosyl hydrolase family 3 N terminal domain-containing protein [Bombardia bombarda]